MNKSVDAVATRDKCLAEASDLKKHTCDQERQNLKSIEGALSTCNDEQSRSLRSLDNTRKQYLIELQAERSKEAECRGKLTEMNTTHSKVLDSSRQQCLAQLSAGRAESRKCKIALAEAINRSKDAIIARDQCLVKAPQIRVATVASEEIPATTGGGKLNLSIDFRQLSEQWNQFCDYARWLMTVFSCFVLFFADIRLVFYLARQKDAQMEICAALKAAWEQAWAEQWDEAENLVKTGDELCRRLSLFEYKDRFTSVAKYAARVQSRKHDPRSWSPADVLDFLQFSTRRAVPLVSADVDGAALMRDKSLLLASWVGSSNRDELERISKALDDMVFEANVRNGSLQIEKARVIRESDLKLDGVPFAAGSAADVYSGVWTNRGKEVRVVVKVLRSFSISSAGPGNADLQNLIREVDHLRVASASEHVVTYHGVMLGQRCGIVMDQEFCCLARVLEQRMLRDTRHRLRILLDTASGLRGIHKANLVHGDIKPSNLLLTCDGRIKIADFSHSSTLCTQRSQLLMAHSAADSRVSGTVHYISPEAWSGIRTAAADVWAFGLIVWHVLTGRLLPWDERAEMPQIICLVVHSRKIPVLPDSLEIPPPVGPSLVGLYRECCGYEHGTRPAAGRLVARLENLIEEIRKDDELPSSWSAVPGQDQYQVRAVPLPPGSAEYAEVAGLFARDCPAHPVVSIERVQNKEQWNLYRQKRQAMEARLPPEGSESAGLAQVGANERRLFHGTRRETVSLINQKSFNRSYCGQNATAYGRGTYFACRSSYSAQPTYSPPDAQGRRCMYLARVLVGASVPGTSAMKEPPRLPGDPTRTYDSTCDSGPSPSMYVVYHDAQAYPEYLITFAAA